MDLKEYVENLEVKERVEYVNVADLGTFSIFDVKNIERKEYVDKENQDRKYYKYVGKYKDKNVIIPLVVLEQIKVFNDNGFTNFNVTKSGSGLATKYMVIPAHRESNNGVY